MVLGLRSKAKRGAAIRVDYAVHIHEIRPWPPSQSLKTLKSAVLQWENGDRSSGSTNPAVPSLGSTPSEGKIEFNESFKVQVNLLKDNSAKGTAFQKSLLELNLYEPRRDKTVRGQHLGGAVIDLAEHGVLKEAVSVRRGSSTSSKESLSKEASLDKDGKDSVSALMNEEYAEEEEELEIEAFTDDDESLDSSHGNSNSASDLKAELPVQTRNEEQEHRKSTSVATSENLEVRNEETAVILESVPTKEEFELPTTSLDLYGAVTDQDGHGTELPSDDACTNTENLDSDACHSGGSKEIDSASPVETSGNLEEENGFSSKNKEIMETDDLIREIHKTKVDYSSKENGIEETIDKKDIGGTSDIDDDTQMELSDVASTKIEDGNDKDGKDQESRNVSENMANGSYADNGDTETNIEEKQMLNGSADAVEEHSIEVQQIIGSPDNSSVAWGVTLEQSPETQQLNFPQDTHKRTFSYDLAASNRSFLGGRVPSTLTTDRARSLRYSMRSPSNLKGIGTYALSYQNREDVKEIDAQNDEQNSETDDQEKANSSPDKVEPVRRIVRNGVSNSEVREMELRVELLESELRESAAIEIGLYSVIPEHGSSAHKVHTPARRLSRLYIHALKHWSRERRGNAARSAASGLVLVAKACGNDVPRHVDLLVIKFSSAKSNPSHMKKSSPLKWESGTRKKAKHFAEDFADWEDPNTFIAALEKIEIWIFSRLVESVWWQTLAPHMQLTREGNESKIVSHVRKVNGRGPFVDDLQQAILSIEIWKQAFKDASERLCPLRAGGHECGCLPMLCRLVMEQCVARLDVAMFNAILRESDDDIPTDPMSDPISNPHVLPIPSGKSSFGAGAQLKNAVGNWSRWLTDLFGMDADDSPQDENRQDDDRVDADASFKSFNLLNALSDLLMLPKDMLLEKSIRKEVCPTFSSSIIKQILENFQPDEFCPDPVPLNVFEALESEDHWHSGEEGIRNIPCTASPIIYSPPSVASVESVIGDVRRPQLRRIGSSVVRKSYTSDDELEELDSPLNSIADKSSTPSPKPKGSTSSHCIRYQLLHEVWRDDD
uniref:C2 NT-type domain-containing protein n=1 Tax=Ananas comosus var. bracteatus TaxID=296719 RepID=A0A6V7Q223_ANACO|nr:unnamed protein product [Ananas comosus var. bracteatus]